VSPFGDWTSSKWSVFCFARFRRRRTRWSYPGGKSSRAGGPSFASGPRGKMIAGEMVPMEPPTLTILVEADTLRSFGDDAGLRAMGEILMSPKLRGGKRMPQNRHGPACTAVTVHAD